MVIEIVPLLAEIATGITTSITASELRQFFAKRSDVVDRAIQATCSRFPEYEGAEVSLQRWTSTETFSEFFSRVNSGERGFDDDVVSSFIDDGEFFLPDDEELTSATVEIIVAFISELSGALYRSDEGLAALASRQESLHMETRSHFDERFSILEERFSSILSSTLASDDSPDRPADSDSGDSKLVTAIDFARDLIRRGLVRTARAELKELQDRTDTLPKDLEFRLLTYLAACALAENDHDDARCLFEAAHQIQPENQQSVANAALAAQLGDHHELAKELALKARKMSQQDSRATAVLLWELWVSGDQERLEELVSTEGWIVSDPQCSLVLARVRVLQSRFEEAITLCRSLVETDPEDPDALLALSECLLHFVQSNSPLVGFSDDTFEKLREAEFLAAKAIEFLRRTELKIRCREALIIRACACALLGQTDDAIGDLDEVLEADPTHPEALYNKGLLLLQDNQPSAARAALKSIQDSVRRADAILPLADACLAAGDEVSAIDLLRDGIELDKPTWKDIHRAETLVRAEDLARVDDSVGPILSLALRSNPSDPKLLALQSARLQVEGKSVGAENSLVAALEGAPLGDRREILVRLGSLYIELRRYGEAADRFAEVVGDVVLHPAANTLLMCLFNSGRFYEALRWSRRIREPFQRPPRIALEIEAAVLESIGDLSAAVQCRENLRSRADSTPEDQVKLSMAQYRSGLREVALETIRRVNTSQLSHDPRLILAVAQMKLILGMPDYLEEAYFARSKGMDDPVIHLGYFAMFQGRDTTWVEPITVGPGCAVLLRSGASEQWWQILEHKEEVTGSYQLTSKDELAEQLLGRNAGEIIVLREDLEELSYEVVSVQSKFVRAFQETAAEFSTRFPGHLGLSRIRVDDDFKRIFQTIDQREQTIREVDQMYHHGRLPFLSFCSLLGRSALEVWRASTHEGASILHFAHGTASEVNDSVDALRQANGIVLDLLALLTIYELGLVDHLRKRFQRVTLPQLVIDEIQQTVFTMKLMGPASGRLSRVMAGQYTLTEETEEEWREWQGFVRSVEEFAESFERIASYRALCDDDREKVFDVLTAAGAGAVYAGEGQQEDSLILLADDLGLSNVARSFGVDTVNTQAVLRELLRSGIVTPQVYASKIERLILINYSFVQVRAEDIASRLEASGYMTTSGTRAMLKTLEGPNCTEDTAVTVAVELINSLSGKGITLDVRMELIVMAVLSALRTGREVRSVLPKFRQRIASRRTLATDTDILVLEAVDLCISTLMHELDQLRRG